MNQTVIIKRLRSRPAPSPNASDRRWWSVKEACDRIGGISPETLHRYRQLGMPSISIPDGNRVLFDPEKVSAWLSERETPAA